MKNRYVLILLTTCLLWFISFRVVFAQTLNAQDGPITNVASPDAAALGNYSNLQSVNYYTGMSVINIPLGQVQIPGATLPVSLMYNASGVKVADIASSVGMGWSLSAGGVVTREVKGYPDDVNDATNGVGYNYSGVSIESWTPTANDLQYMEDNKYDGEPDIFSFTFGGRTGKFVINSTWDVKLIPYQDLKVQIERTTSGASSLITGIIITDESGAVYTFRQVERNQIAIATSSVTAPSATWNTTNKSLDYNSSWYLSDVASPNGKHITLEYDTLSQSYVTPQSIMVNNCPDNNCNYVAADQNFYSTSTSTYTVTAKQLRRIYSDYQEVLFSNSATRTDLSGGKGLTSVAFYNKSTPLTYTTANDNFLIKKYVLDHEYHGVTGEQRWFLTSIKESRNGTSLNPYKFFYNNWDNLPGRMSNAIDFWGYYNGQTGNTTTIPQIWVYTSQAPNNEKFSVFVKSGVTVSGLSGANRNANTGYITTGILNKISYPDSGYTVYNYEPHQFQAGVYGTITGGGIRIKDATTYDGFNTEKKFYRKYDYTLVDNTPSGQIVSLPVFAFDDGSNGSATANCSDINYYKNRVKRSSSALNGSGIFEIGYTRVSEYMGDNGKTVYEYNMPGTFAVLTDDGGVFVSPATSMVKHPSYASVSMQYSCGAPDYAVGSPPTYNYAYPYAPLPAYSWARGLLTKRTVYDQKGNFVSQQAHTYTFSATGTQVHGIKSARIHNPGTATPSVPLDLYLYSKYYHLTGVAKIRTSTTETLACLKPVGQTNPMVTTTNYTYGNTNLLVPTETRTTNSDGIEYTQKTIYCSAYNTTTVTGSSNSEGQALKAMADRHILNIPVEQLTYQKKPSQSDVAISGSFTTFKVLTSTGNPIVPATQYGTRLTAPGVTVSLVNASGNFIYDFSHYELKKTFDVYDVNANLLQASVPKGMATSTVYGYNQFWSVATFTNAHRTNTALGDECSYAGFESTLNYGSDVDNDYWHISTSANLYNADGHTGKNCYKDNATGSLTTKDLYREFRPTNQQGRYVFSCWIKGSSSTTGKVTLYAKADNDASTTVIGTASSTTFGTGVSGYTANTWIYVEAILDLGKMRQLGSIPAGTLLRIRCEVENQSSGFTDHYYVDDVQFRPYNSTSNYITYHIAFGSSTGKTDNTNYTTYSEYDNFGRPLYTLDKDKNLLSYTEYYQKSSSSSTDHSYVKTYKTVAAGVNYSSLSTVQASSDVRATVNYLDGLGRPIQQTAIKTTPLNNDVVSPIEYDALGRQLKNYLPFASSDGLNGVYRSTMLTQLTDFYNKGQRIARCSNPWYENRFESSLLNRVVERSSPGFEWRMDKGHTIRHNYRTNTCDDNILYWQYNYANQRWEATQLYGEYTLYVDETRDENFNWIITFKDKLGRVICTYTQKKTFAGNELKQAIQVPPPFYYSSYTATYNLYDDLGHLVGTIDPEGMQQMATANSFILTSDILTKWVTTFNYDARGRLISKNLGNESEELYVYDTLDRVVLSRTKALATNDWNFTKYDEQGRVVMRGIYTNTSGVTQASLQQSASNATYLYEDRTNANNGYTNQAFPTHDEAKVLSVNYLDDYDFDYNGTNDVTVPGTAKDQKHCGRVTGSKQRTLTPAAAINSTWYATQSFYDDFGRVVKAHADNHLGVADDVTSTYNFIDAQLTKTRVHGTTTILQEYEYDYAQRLTKVYHTINAGTKILLKQINYNELGGAYEKNLYAKSPYTSFLQSVDYSYDALGHLIKINRTSLSTDVISKPISGVASRINMGALARLNGQLTNNVTSAQYSGVANTAAANAKADQEQQLMNAGGPVDFTDVSAITVNIVGKWMSSLTTLAGGADALEQALNVLPCGITYYSDRRNAPGFGTFPAYPATAILKQQLSDDLLAGLNGAGTLDRTTTNNTAKSVLTTSLTNYGLSSYSIADASYFLPAANPNLSNCGNYIISSSYNTNLSTAIVNGLNTLGSSATITQVNNAMAGVINQYGQNCKMTYLDGLKLYMLNNLQHVIPFGNPMPLNMIVSNTIAAYGGSGCGLDYSTDLQTQLMNALNPHPWAPGEEIGTALITPPLNTWYGMHFGDAYCVNPAITSSYFINDTAQTSPASIKALSRDLAWYATRQLEEEGYREAQYAQCAFQGYYTTQAQADSEYAERPNTTKFTYEVQYAIENGLNTAITGGSYTESTLRSTINSSLQSYVNLSMAPISPIPGGILVYNDDNNDLWGMELEYASMVESKAQYNGNIAREKWRATGDANTNVYDYSYDALDRLTSAKYFQVQDYNTSVNADLFNVDLISYDNNGNIKQLQRRGCTTIGTPNTYGVVDNLTYNYEGNKLLAAEDAISNASVSTGALNFLDDPNSSGAYSYGNTATYDYLYTSNGSMTTDRNRGISSITYNLLNLPATITFSNGNKVEFTYMANGTKLTEKITVSGAYTQTDYVGDMIYQSSTAAPTQTLAYFFHEEGRVVKNGSAYEYEFTIKDQVGNARFSFKDNGSGVAIKVQRNDYYPFGMPNGVLTDVSGTNPYMFTGKEWISQAGLNMYDYGWRHYDPTIGRWHCPDPAGQHFSPYLFSSNNPMKSVDPNGYWDWPIPPCVADQVEYQMDRAEAAYYGPLQQEVAYASNLNPQWAINDQMMAEYNSGIVEQFYSQNIFRGKHGGDGTMGFMDNPLGNFLVSSIPVFGPVVNFVNAIQKGNYEGAVVNLALGAVELGGVASMTRATVATATDIAGASASRTVYRAVSIAEMDDINSFGGFRQAVNGMSYEGKLFANTIEDAVSWGKDMVAGWENKSFTIAEVKIPADYKFDYKWNELDGRLGGAVHVDYGNLGNFNNAINSINFYTPNMNQIPIPTIELPIYSYPY